MKTSTLIATIVGGVIVVGGAGTAAGVAIAGSDDSPPTAIETVTPTPDESAEPVETAEPSETVEPTPVETVEPEYSEAERELIQVTHFGDLSNLDLSDAEILEAAQQVCAERDAGLHEDQMVVGFPAATEAQNIQFRINAVGTVCVAQS